MPSMVLCGPPDFWPAGERPGAGATGGLAFPGAAAARSAPQAAQKDSPGLVGVPQLGQREGTVMGATR